MTKSRKKRSVIVVRTISVKDSPSYYKELKTKLFEKLNKELRAYLDITTNIHRIIDSELQKAKSLESDQLSNYANLVKSHALIDRSALIECVIILDSSINQALYNFQLQSNSESEKLISDSKIEEKINECLKNISLTPEFENKRTIIKYFRELRNQFAHSPMGMFFIKAEKESFESFLKKIEGIEINKSWWVSENGTAGVAIPFKITSNLFLENFFKESLVFFVMLVELLFPKDRDKL